MPPFDHCDHTDKYCLQKWQNSSLGRGLAEGIASHLATASGLDVVEREKLQDLLGQLGDVDLQEGVKASDLGQRLSADYVLVGSFEAQEDDLKVNVRVIDAIKGAAVCALTLTSDDRAYLEASMAHQIAERLDASLPEPSLLPVAQLKAAEPRLDDDALVLLPRGPGVDIRFLGLGELFPDDGSGSPMFVAEFRRDGGIVQQWGGLLFLPPASSRFPTKGQVRATVELSSSEITTARVRLEVKHEEADETETRVLWEKEQEADVRETPTQMNLDLSFPGHSTPELADAPANALTLQVSSDHQGCVKVVVRKLQVEVEP